MYVLGILAALTSAAIWGLIGPTFRGLYAFGVEPITVGLVRGTGAALCVAIFALVRHRDSFRELFRQLPYRIASGLFGVVGVYLLSNIGMVRIPIGFATVLFYTSPLWVIAMAALWGKESLTRIRLVALALGLGGVWFAVGGVEPGHLDLVGILCMLLSGFSYAAFILNGKYGLGRTDPFANYFATFFWGAVLMWCIAVPTGSLACLRGLPLKGWLLLAYVVAIPTLLAYGILLAALKVIPGTVASILSTAELAFAIFWSGILLGEHASLQTILGAAAIAGAVALLTLEGSDNSLDALKRFFSREKKASSLSKEP
ncbi:DMT family transporter [Aminiphilus circumscriptus]|jgi:drug/metabolite transporter (DMT)-like permease|uniref:DMT family transporter n=1 Tax=Aminiphilus circumscriptus TaxID=290732 RepID=UPI000478528B|nr:DMT family transporter [Aminiphilus circumscriptus]